MEDKIIIHFINKIAQDKEYAITIFSIHLFIRDVYIILGIPYEEIIAILPKTNIYTNETKPIIDKLKGPYRALNKIFDENIYIKRQFITNIYNLYTDENKSTLIAIICCGNSFNSITFNRNLYKRVKLNQLIGNLLIECIFIDRFRDICSPDKKCLVFFD